MAILDDLISYWKLDETSGTRNDAHGTNHLTVNGGAPSATGKLGNAIDLEPGSNQFLSCADSAGLSGGGASFTISAWVRIEDKPGSGFMVIASKHDASTTNAEYILYWNQPTDRFVFNVYQAWNVTGSVTATAAGSPSTGVWYFVIAWYDAANQKVGISVNGVEATPTTYTSGVADTTENFRIGATGSGGTNKWDGLIDEVGFWKRVLTSRERAHLYNGGTGLTYPFEPQLLSYFIVPGGSKSEATMDTNVTALQAYADDVDGRLTKNRQRLQLLADFYYFNDTVRIV